MHYDFYKDWTNDEVKGSIDFWRWLAIKYGMGLVLAIIVMMVGGVSSDPPASWVLGPGVYFSLLCIEDIGVSFRAMRHAKTELSRRAALRRDIG